MLAYQAGRAARVEELGRHLLDESVARGDDLGTVRGLGLRSMAASVGGEHAEALAFAREALLLVEQLDRQGDLRSPEDQELVPWVHNRLGIELLARGEWAAAEEHFRVVRERDEALGYARGLRIVHSNLGALHSLAGDPPQVEQALVHYGQALDLSWQHRDRWSYVLSTVGLAYLAARVRKFELAGRLVGAADALRKDTDYTLYAHWKRFYEDVEADLDRESRTQPALSELRASVPALGWEQLVQPIRTWLLEIATGVHRGKGVRPQPFDLTEREMEVLDLARQGLTDKEIAARLFIAVRTVKAHLANAYAKTDTHSRTEAVYAVFGNGAPRPKG